MRPVRGVSKALLEMPLRRIKRHFGSLAVRKLPKRLQGTLFQRNWILSFGLHREMVTLPRISGAGGSP